MGFFDQIKEFFAKYQNDNSKKVTKYIGCYRTSTFHRPGCKCIKMMSRENLIFYDSSVTYQTLVGLKMKPCSKCKPK